MKLNIKYWVFVPPKRRLTKEEYFEEYGEFPNIPEPDDTPEEIKLCKENPKDLPI